MTVWGFNTIEIFIKKGTRYDSHQNRKKDQIWLQWLWKWGHNMNVILLIKGTKLQYCFRIGVFMIAISFKKDQIWFESSKNCFDEIFSEIIVSWLRDQFRHLVFLKEIAIIWDCFRTEIAIVFTPYNNSHCNHLRSPFLWRLQSLQSYFVIFAIQIAIIFIPFQKKKISIIFTIIKMIKIKSGSALYVTEEIKVTLKIANNWQLIMTGFNFISISCRFM